MQVFFAGEGKAGENKNLSVFAYVEVFWWARVDSNNQYIIFIGLPGCFSCVLAAL